MKKKPKKPFGFRQFIFITIIVIASGIFLISGLKLLSITLKYKKGSDAYKKIEDLSGKTTDDSDPDAVFFDVPALKAINADTKGYEGRREVASMVGEGENGYSS